MSEFKVARINNALDLLGASIRRLEKADKHIKQGKLGEDIELASQNALICVARLEYLLKKERSQLK